MKQWWQRFSEHRVVAHLLRAHERFTVRGGGQFAAAVSYFSVLSLVPILMVAFSALGLTLTVVRPESLADVQAWVGHTLAGYGDLGDKLVQVMTAALSNWATLGATGLVVAAWSGATWMGNLKRAMRALMREGYDRPAKELPLPVEVLANLGGLIVIFVAVVVSAAATTAATALTRELGDWLGLTGLGWVVVVRLVGFVVALGIGASLFWWIFRWFSATPVRPHLLWLGASVGAVGLLALQVLASYLIGVFSRNLAASVFGSVIILMMFFNLFATLILYVAAWLATDNPPVPAITVAEPVSELPTPPTRPGQEVVSAEVARRSMGVGLVAGYSVGAATGLGVGAVLVSVLSRLLGKRRPR